MLTMSLGSNDGRDGRNYLYYKADTLGWRGIDSGTNYILIFMQHQLECDMIAVVDYNP